jgi:hypothetical protein
MWHDQVTSANVIIIDQVVISGSSRGSRCGSAAAGGSSRSLNSFN